MNSGLYWVCVALASIVSVFSSTSYASVCSKAFSREFTFERHHYEDIARTYAGLMRTPRAENGGKVEVTSSSLFDRPLSIEGVLEIRPSKPLAIEVLQELARISFRRYFIVSTNTGREFLVMTSKRSESLDSKSLKQLLQEQFDANLTSIEILKMTPALTERGGTRYLSFMADLDSPSLIGERGIEVIDPYGIYDIRWKREADGRLSAHSPFTRRRHKINWLRIEANEQNFQVREDHQKYLEAEKRLEEENAAPTRIFQEEVNYADFVFEKTGEKTGEKFGEVAGEETPQSDKPQTMALVESLRAQRDSTGRVSFIPSAGMPVIGVDSMRRFFGAKGRTLAEVLSLLEGIAKISPEVLNLEENAKVDSQTGGISYHSIFMIDLRKLGWANEGARDTHYRVDVVSYAPPGVDRLSRSVLNQGYVNGNVTEHELTLN